MQDFLNIESRDLVDAFAHISKLDADIESIGDMIIVAETVTASRNEAKELVLSWAKESNN